ncbi:hypothetical protein LBBP_00649 [Leptospira borgpetersenii serovar Ballum]|uniref:Uncharacterized protein n=1 Tax=Leptospira borgpetersenii serovar Ballum TaxID=280505 RepID=A0A0S2IND9_LEPBO|nr:hypothetical protein LBBP_00649 [Leptospira borgpetersenii serovar Ballum]
MRPVRKKLALLLPYIPSSTSHSKVSLLPSDIPLHYECFCLRLPGCSGFPVGYSKRSFGNFYVSELVEFIVFVGEVVFHVIFFSCISYYTMKANRE